MIFIRHLPVWPQYAAMWSAVMPSLLLDIFNDWDERNTSNTGKWPFCAAKWTAVNPAWNFERLYVVDRMELILKIYQSSIDESNTLFSSEHDAPALTKTLTTWAWPPSAANWSGVASVIRFLAEITPFLSNFINSTITVTDPCIAAMWAQVFPSYGQHKNVKQAGYTYFASQTFVPRARY